MGPEQLEWRNSRTFRLFQSSFDIGAHLVTELVLRGQPKKVASVLGRPRRIRLETLRDGILSLHPVVGVIPEIARCRHTSLQSGIVNVVLTERSGVNLHSPLLIHTGQSSGLSAAVAECLRQDDQVPVSVQGRQSSSRSAVEERISADEERREEERSAARLPLFEVERSAVTFHLRSYAARSRALSMRILRTAIRRRGASQLQLCFLSRRTVRTPHGWQKLREGGKIRRA